jgi:hypothetical protein
MADPESKNRPDASDPHGRVLLPPTAEVGSWSAAELRAELRQTRCDLRTAEALEAAVERRHAAEATPEAEERPSGAAGKRPT